MASLEIIIMFQELWNNFKNDNIISSKKDKC